MNERPDLNLPDLVGLLQDTVTHLQAANQYQAWWWAIRPPVWGVQRALERTRNCAACGLPIAIGQPYWIWSMDGGLVTHTGVTACARVALAIIGLAICAGGKALLPHVGATDHAAPRGVIPVCAGAGRADG